MTRQPSARRPRAPRRDPSGMLAGLYWTVAQPVESRLGCWPGDKCDFACALRNIRASCGDEGVGMVPPSLMHHDGSPECQWCSDIADDAACRAAYFVDFWQGAMGVAAIRRCEWHDEEGLCRAFEESVMCGPRSSPPPPYPPLFSNSAAAPPPSVLMLGYADGGGAISATSHLQPSPPPPATLLNALELRAYRGGQIVANASMLASLTAAHGVKTASGVLASSVVPKLASTMVGEVEHALVASSVVPKLTSTVVGEVEQAAETQNASLLLFAIPALSFCCCLALCCLLSRCRRIRVAEDDELEELESSPPGSPHGAAARPGQHKKKLARTVGRCAKHRYEFK